jgi:hypothetical protein
LQIPLKEGIGGEREGDFTDNFIVYHPVPIHVMTHEAKVLIRSSSTLKHNCQVSSAKMLHDWKCAGCADQVRSPHTHLPLYVGWLLLLYSSKLGTMLSSPVSHEEGKVARQETLFHWVPIP